MNHDSLVLALKETLSNRAAAFVAHKLLEKHGIVETRGLGKAKDHVRVHGPRGSAKAQVTLTLLVRYSRQQLEEWVRLAGEVAKQRRLKFKADYACRLAQKNLSDWLKTPLTKNEREALEEKELSDWYRDEGRYEEALELAGLYKTHLYECERARQFYEPEPTLKDTVAREGGLEALHVAAQQYNG